MKSALTRVFISVSLLFLIGTFSGVAQEKSFTILHTNDIHASFIPHEATWIRSDPKPMIGGFAELSWMIDSIRKAKSVSVLLDGGDVMTGNPISDIEYMGASGGALFSMMNMMGYDAWTIGNHDLDISQDNLKKLTSIAAFPTVSANLTDSSGAWTLNNKPYVILKKDGVTFGVIGLMSKELFLLTNTKNLKGLKVSPPAEVAQKYIDELTPQSDVVIALTHEGVDEDSVLAVSTHGLNIIIGGHSHTRLEHPKLINRVIICQTGSNCENLGELDVTIDNHKVTKYQGELHHLWIHHNAASSQIADLISDMKKKIDEDYNQVIGTLVTDWKRGGGESNLGDFVADAMRESEHADVGITNSSGLRKDLSAGPIRKLDLSEILPFRNYLCTFPMTGKELRRLASDHARSLVHGRPSLQISGLECEFRKSGDTVEIKSLKVGGQDVDDAKSYTVATSDFLINQADKYLGMIPAHSTMSDMLMFDAMVAKVLRDKTIDSKIEHRFKDE
ncbi:MAG TPA: bifunctional UDP-sugar hydrolase/5'-nucleotidase [Bacteroidota bacterium]|nr:bifunctional UDP-sugar hydrolase/5'-nucleotidase [Bacteroidota bacterium]